VSDPHDALKAFKPQKAFFVGIDSDGCVFDTMEIKHKECFIPNIIKHWGLQPVSKFAREAAEFVNLYSKERGINRWPALISVFDLLRERPEVQARHADIPQAQPIRDFIASGKPLGNVTLEELVKETGDAVLAQGLTWSKAVNGTVADIVENVPPFPFVRESLAKMVAQAWAEHNVDKYVRLICGQEMGTKTEHLRAATNGRYDANKMLMIGDAPGDLKAARANNAKFYPVNPGHEDASWQRFYEESLDKFFAGEYTVEYEQKLIDEFQVYLPELPPWKR